MASTELDLRNRAFGQEWRATPVDEPSIYFGAKQPRRSAGGFCGLDVAYAGSGHHAAFARSMLAEVRSLTLVAPPAPPRSAAAH